MNIWPCRSFVYQVAGEMDLAQAGGRLNADSAKLLSAQMGTKVASRAMQIMGGLWLCRWNTM